jgi:hypothetical protein
MLQALGEEIANALESAAVANRRASDATDPIVRAEYERLARSWQMVARSFEFVESLVESLEQLLNDSQQRGDLLPPAAE